MPVQTHLPVQYQFSPHPRREFHQPKAIRTSARRRGYQRCGVRTGRLLLRPPVCFRGARLSKRTGAHAFGDNRRTAVGARRAVPLLHHPRFAGSCWTNDGTIYRGGHMTPVNPGALLTRGILCFRLAWSRYVSAVSGTTRWNIEVRAST